MLRRGPFAQQRVTEGLARACRHSWPPPYLDGQDLPASLAADMHGAWGRFVTDGDPGWARYETNGRPVMVIDEPSAVHEDLLAMERVAWA